jgi:cell division protein FtsW (lipid II flippase)
MEMKQKTRKVNKPMFWVGLAMIVIAATLLLMVKEDLGMSPMILGIIGIVTIGASKYRPLK